MFRFIDLGIPKKRDVTGLAGELDARNNPA